MKPKKQAQKIELIENMETILQVGQKQMEDVLDKNVTCFADGFSYGILEESVINKITGVSYPKGDAKISIDDLSHIKLMHYDFEGNLHNGELIVHKSVAKEVTGIFYKLYIAKYPMTSVKLIDDFGADDAKSMKANNTSAFNYRLIAGSNVLSNHGKGMAIDINPLYNPCVDGNGKIEPQDGRMYADRGKDFPGKIDENDVAYGLFKEAGWKWGGHWNSLKDYQHFEKSF